MDYISQVSAQQRGSIYYTVCIWNNFIEKVRVNARAFQERDTKNCSEKLLKQIGRHA